MGKPYFMGKAVAMILVLSDVSRPSPPSQPLLEIEVKESETKGFITYVVIHMRTGDGAAKFEGDIQLTYRRAGGALKLDGVDNLSFRITDMEQTAADAYAPPPARPPRRCRPVGSNIRSPRPRSPCPRIATTSRSTSWTRTPWRTSGTGINS